MKGFVIVEPLTGIFFALKAMHHFYTAAWDALFCNFNCQHEVFYLKIGYFYFFKYVKGFSSSPTLLLENKPQSFTWTKLVLHALFHLVYHFLVLQVPLNNLTLQQICGTNYLIYFWSSFAFSFSPLPQRPPPPFLSHSWKKACSKLSSALACVTSYTADISENVYQLLQS